MVHLYHTFIPQGSGIIAEEMAGRLLKPEIADTCQETLFAGHSKPLHT